MVQRIMEDRSLIPSLRFDGAAVGRTNRFDAWREAIRCVYDVEPLAAKTGELEHMEGWLVDNLIFTEVAFSRQSFSHHTRHAQDANYLSFQIYKSGGSVGIAEEQAWKMEPGQVHIYDFSRRFHSIAEDSVVAGVKIPHEAIGYDPGRHPAVTTFSGNSSVGRFLMDTFFAIQRRLPELRQDEAAVLAQGFCGLVRGVLIPQERQENTTARMYRAERRAAMRSYLDRRLSDANLGIGDLLHAFGVSRTSIYRDFADVGGVAAYINNRRLDRAFHRLISASPSPGRVKEIANRTGFNDPAHFNRLFRQRFGITPGSTMTSRPAPDIPYQRPVESSASPAALQLSNWFSGM